MGSSMAEEIKDLMGLGTPAEAPLETEAENVGAESNGGKPATPEQTQAVEKPAEEAGAEKTVVPEEETKAEQPIEPAAAVEEKPKEETAEEPWKVREAALLAEIDRLSKGAQPAAEEKPKEEAPRTVPVVKTPEAKADPLTAFSDEILQEAFGYECNLEKVRNVLRSIHSTAIEDALRMIPVAAEPVIKQQMTLNGLVDQFYKSNPDLVGLKAYVGQVGTELESKHPDWDVPTLFAETEKEVRNRLQKPKVVAEPQVNRPAEKKPAFAKGGGKAPEAPQLTGMAKEINDLL